MKTPDSLSAFKTSTALSECISNIFHNISDWVFTCLYRLHCQRLPNSIVCTLGILAPLRISWQFLTDLGMSWYTGDTATNGSSCGQQRLYQMGSMAMDSTSIRCDGSRKLLFIWACGTTDFVTDILFLVNSIKTTSWTAFWVGCICSLDIILMLQAWKLIATCQVIMSEKGSSSLESRLVNLANSPGLFFIYSCRPSKLDDFVDFIETSRPWSAGMFKRMLMDMVLEDIPSVVLNSVDMFQFGNGGFLNWISLLASVVHVLVCWWLLRSRDTATPRTPRAKSAEDGVAAVNSVLGVAESLWSCRFWCPLVPLQSTHRFYSRLPPSRSWSHGVGAGISWLIVWCTVALMGVKWQRSVIPSLKKVDHQCIGGACRNILVLACPCHHLEFLEAARETANAPSIKTYAPPRCRTWH